MSGWMYSMQNYESRQFVFCHDVIILWMKLWKLFGIYKILNGLKAMKQTSHYSGF